MMKFLSPASVCECVPAHLCRGASSLIESFLHATVDGRYTESLSPTICFHFLKNLSVELNLKSLTNYLKTSSELKTLREQEVIFCLSYFTACDKIVTFKFVLFPRSILIGVANNLCLSLRKITFFHVNT